MTAEAPDRVRYNILGTLEIWVDQHRLRLGGPIQERVLVTLLLEPGKCVPVARLVEAVWEDEPPATAVHQVRKAVADLRRRIPDGASLVLTDGPGYRAVPQDDQLDLGRFTRLTEQARLEIAAGAPHEAADLLREALALWRGPVLAGRGGAVLTSAATALDERRVAVVEQLFQLRLDQGEAAELVGDLHAYVAEHPLRETLRALLMLALYRSGRAAEALAEYGKVREMLVEELGIDPGARLTKLYEAVLRNSEELVLAEPAPPAQAPGAAAPRVPAAGPSTLPYDLTDFTGREAELERLLACADEHRGSTRIVAVDGMGGIGKTSLAVRAAHQLADRYPDGQLYINLLGYSPGEQPLGASAVLGALLRTLGVPDQRIPEDQSGRTALWRATVAGRKVLLVLDNALNSAQVLPLLPASPGCLVLVTSRAALLDLDSATRLHIEVLSPEDSAAMFAETLGEQRMAAEPDAAAALAELCGHLPLALRIASARLRNRRRWTVQYLVDRMRDETRRLNELSAGERSVAATIRLSYQAMDERHRTAFRLGGLHPGKDIDVMSFAALMGTDRWEAEAVLERLLDEHLVQQQEIGRYTLHDLVRTFARSLRPDTPAVADQQAVERIVDYYVAVSERACAVLFPGRSRRFDHHPPPVTAESPELESEQQARDWFAREHSALLSAVVLAHEQGLDAQTGLLARNVLYHLHLRSYFEEYGAVAQLAVDSARRRGDARVLHNGLTNLVSSRWKLGRFREGLTAAAEALELARSSGDVHGEAVSLDQLGLLHGCLGELREGREHLLRSIALHEHPMRKEMALCNLSSVCAWLGRFEESAAAAEEAVSLRRSDGDLAVGVAALNDLAIARLALGEPERAAGCLREARGLGDGSAMSEELALTLALSADTAQRLGRAESVVAYEERALELVRTRGTALRRCQVENIVGRLRRQRGLYEQALELHESAARCAASIEYRVELARALDGRADASKALGDAAAEARLREEADGLFAAMGMPVLAR
ncbi:BTAD domain-containing putative transcriptional regulator [Streptomyces sp. NPDC049813]|uniref:AfsR/SARP family transcriptional regulator n=1 Tax=Streptomyces sp. NPDC049813 TaxID=3365597 RepID=UPI0037947123